MNCPSQADLLKRSMAWADKLLGGPVAYFPVRHHSPACAQHVAAIVETLRPDSIIIEGPRSMDRWIDPLARDDCQGPVALLTTFVQPGENGSADDDGLRHSAFFPLCDYSPEWVALRMGKAAGAKVRFADMEFADKVMHRQSEDPEDRKSLLGVLLADESNLRHSEFIDSLVRRLGCRDFDEVWDHLFESTAGGESSEDFVGKVATYCDLSRQSHTVAAMHADATLARESVMAEVIRSEIKRLKNPKRRGAILVVTGGFHTVALPDLVSSRKTVASETKAKFDPSAVASYLIRYSDDQLDSLSGYQSGMPSPGFYDCLWQARRAGRPVRSAVAGLISSIARQTRGQAIGHEASVTDSISALEMLDRLAELRGHESPTRMDLIDAVTSSMRKDSVAGDLLGAIIDKTLAGSRVGSVPPGVDRVPVIDDFVARAGQYRFPVSTIEPRNATLELYRKAAHRGASCFLHQLQTLGVPYAQFVDGPDFVHGHRLGKLTETWTLAWSPRTEARLAEMAMMGDSVASAAAATLARSMRAIEDGGGSGDAAVACELLIRACRMGLQTHASELLSIAGAHIATDPVFASLATALSRFEMLRSARGPLQIPDPRRIGDVAGQAYRRACYLIDTLGQVPDDQLDASLDGLLSIYESLCSGDAAERDRIAAEHLDHDLDLDPDFFFDSLIRLIDPTGKPARSEIAGAAAGILFGRGLIDQAAVCDVVRRYLDASVQDVSDACGVVRGLMATSREAFWRLDELLGQIDRLFASWETERFHQALPHLRLAFSRLAPKEIDRVAERVAHLHGNEDLGHLAHSDLTEDDLAVAVMVAGRMDRSLEEDGLR